jgi:hypothetical protein
MFAFITAVRAATPTRLREERAAAVPQLFG